jgi:glycosyltransferase involved in cell wall biosynthesis
VGDFQESLAASIVIPAYNASRTIKKCVEACLAQDYPHLEIIVVDDGSTDETEDILSDYPICYVKQENAGPASARNRGWRAAAGEVICFTDSDCVPALDWVSMLLKEYAAADIAGVGGTYDIANSDSLLASCIHEEIVQRHLKMPKYVNYLGSFNASYRRDVLKRVGGFDESYRTASGEDNDLAYRIAKLGNKLVFTCNSRVAHYHPDHLWSYLRHQFWHGYWRMKLYRDHRDMMKGDAYAGWADFLQVPLALATLCLAPFGFVPVIAWLIALLVGLSFLLQLPLLWAILKRSRQIKYVALAPIVFLRSYARGMGTVSGVLRFFFSARNV